MPDALHDANKDGLIKLDENGVRDILKACCDIRDHAELITVLVSAGKLAKADVETYLNLFRHHFDDIARLAGSEDVLSAELSEANAMCRDANIEIRRLQKELGDKISARAVSGGIGKFESLFETWYGMAGFKYMSLSFSRTGITAESSSDLYKHDYSDPDNIDFEYMIDKLIGPKLISDIPFAFDDCDARPDGYHFELLDTEKNRRHIEKLFSDAFPNSVIYGFSSHADRKQYLLRVKAFVPYSDIEDLFDRLLEGKR